MGLRVNFSDTLNYNKILKPLKLAVLKQPEFFKFYHLVAKAKTNPIYIITVKVKNILLYGNNKAKSRMSP